MGDSLRAYGDHAGVSSPAVLKWKRAGQLVLDPDGTINRAASDVLRKKLIDPSRAGGRGRESNAGLSADVLHAARAAREGFEARISEITLRKLSGDVHDVGACNKNRFAEARRARNLLMGLPARLAPIVAGLSNEAACYNAIEDEVMKVAAEIAESEPANGNGKHG